MRIAGQIKPILRRSSISILSLGLFLTFLFPPCLDLVFAQSVVTEQNLVDAILGREEFTPDQLGAMDLNEDGRVDVADLVFFLRPGGPPFALFDSSTSVAIEGDGEVSIPVVFSRHFTGELNFSVTGGTATSGTDYEALSGSVSVDGTSALIPVTIIDDTEMEEGETIILSLESGLDYEFGITPQHMLVINENDALWLGSIESQKIRFSFEMEIIQSDGNAQAVVRSDGVGALPPSPEDGWPVQLQITEDTFQATIGPIPISAGQTLTQAEFDRTFILSAAPGQDPYVFDLARTVAGRSTDTFEPVNPDQSHLRLSVTGIFILLKPATFLEGEEPVLEDVP